MKYSEIKALKREWLFFYKSNLVSMEWREYLNNHLRDTELAALRARVGELERERDELQGLVFDISGWLSNWEPDFTEDDEWEDVAKRIDAALAKGAK